MISVLQLVATITLRSTYAVSMLGIYAEHVANGGDGQIGLP
jgi:hypothetical protein